jgi:hypothetical protein
LNHASSSFCSGYFGDGVSRTIYLGQPRTAILLISASQVARITDVNAQLPSFSCDRSPTWCRQLLFQSPIFVVFVYNLEDIFV